jgi:hypothetical protein
MALKDMKSNLAIGVGSKQSPQSFQDGHSATTVTGQKSFGQPPRIVPAPSKLSALSRQSEQLNYEFGNTFNTPSIVESTKDTLDSYYNRVFKNSDPLGARNNDRLGFDEPFIIKGIGDRWGPGGLGKLDFGLVRAGAVTQAARTVADVIRIGKFLLTPRGIGFAIKQDILQKMNAGGELGFGTLGAMLGQKLGKPVTLNAKQQRFSTGRDVFRNVATGKFGGQGYPTVDEMKGSDIRTWRPTSLIDSLPIGAHYVRHKVPAGSPSVQLVKNVGNFLVDSGDGVLKFIDGIDVAFPHVSLNPSFQAGDILTGAGKAIKGAVNGIADVFPNIYDTAKSGAQALGEGIGNIVGGIQLPKITLGRLDAFTSIFPSLTQLPKVQAPDFSALKGILGGLANVAASLISSISLPGLKLPNISLPKLPNLKLPKLPKINLPDINIGNPFKAIGKAISGINLNFPKFSGSGGLGLGSFPIPDKSFAFPRLRLGAEFSKGSLHFDMAALDLGKAKFQAGLENLIKLPNALELVPSKRTGTTGIPEWANHGLPYGKAMTEKGSKIGPKGKGGFEGVQGEEKPKLYYTTAQPSVGQDSKGALRNIYNEEDSYVEIIVPKKGNTTVDLDTGVAAQKLGIGYDKKKKVPIAIQAGFLSGARYGIEDKNFPLNTEKRSPLNVNITPTFPDNVVQKAGSTAARLQKYEMLSYGSLDSKGGESFSEKNPDTDANTTRGIGHQGGPSRTAVDDDGNTIQVTGGAGYKGKADLINLHPYGGTTADDRLNDTNIDFVPLKFRDMVNGKWIIFRCILESVSDTSSPEFAEERYIGRPDKVYVYQGATRNVNITFKVAPKTVQELITLWDKLNYLRGLIYPTIQNNRMVSPFFNFTLGDMFEKQPMIFQSLNYSIDAASTWEIKPGLRLPKLINVSADMRVIDKTTPETTSKHYGLNWLPEGKTFGGDPDLPHQIVPIRTKYTELWKEVGPTLSEEVQTKLIAGTAAIIAQEAAIDKLKSDVDIPNFDIPKVPGSIF